jgi:hypothetical protein
MFPDISVQHERYESSVRLDSEPFDTQALSSDTEQKIIEFITTGMNSYDPHILERHAVN